MPAARRVVVDTNTVVSGILIPESVPGRLLRYLGAAGAPMLGHAQAQSRVAQVGILTTFENLTPEAAARTPFFIRLRELGWEDGRNLLIERRSARPGRDLARDARDLAALKLDVMYVLGGPSIRAASEVVRHASRLRLVGVYAVDEWVDSGGLASYGIDVADQFRRAAGFVDKILRGAKPAELPVEEPTNWELALNMKAAREQGIKLPQSVLVRATRVIE